MAMAPKSVNECWCSACLKRFTSLRAFSAHTTKNEHAELNSRSCFSARAILRDEFISTWHPDQVDQHRSAESTSAKRKAGKFEWEMRKRADSRETTAFLLESRAVRRYFNNVPLRHLEFEREDTKRLMSMVSDELCRKLSPNMTEGEIVACVMNACDIYRGMETTFKEDSLRRRELQEHGLTPVTPVCRTLYDEDGAPSKHVCYDLPIDATLEYLLQSRPDVWKYVCSASREWVQNGYARLGEKVTVLSDLTDGEVYRSHPTLGDAAASAAHESGDEFPRLKLILYYDEVETVNAVGAFTGKHKIGLFYYALVFAARVSSSCHDCIVLQDYLFIIRAHECCIPPHYELLVIRRLTYLLICKWHFTTYSWRPSFCTMISRRTVRDR